MTLTYREYRPNELNAVSILLDGVFPGGHVGPDDFLRLREVSDDFTVAVAEQDGRLVGAIPMLRRAVRVAPGVTLDAWFQFRVGVSADCRGQGVGHGIQSEIARMLKGRGDVLMIISTSEAARPYRFYRANGFHDVCYPRRADLPAFQREPPADPGISVVSAAEFFADTARWAALFNDCYADGGGYIVRTPRFLVPARTAMLEARGRPSIYRVVRERGRPAGYAIVRQTSRGSTLEELAVEGARTDLAGRLIAAARAASGGLTVTTTGAGPVARALETMGQPAPGRWKNSNAVVVKPLDIPAVGLKLGALPPSTAPATLRIWTPEREAVLWAPPGAARELTLELKEDMLARLLVRRLDLGSAFREERVTLKGALPGDAEALAAALPSAPWMFQPIDGL